MIKVKAYMKKYLVPIVLILTCFVLSTFLLYYIITIVQLKNFLSERDSLFENCNKAELLDECRKLIENPEIFIKMSKDYRNIKIKEKEIIIYFNNPHSAAECKYIPRVISNLQPGSIFITDEHVIIVMYSGHSGLSVKAYKEGVTGKGDEMIIDGLWINRR